jgi:hypothetical protein
MASRVRLAPQLCLLLAGCTVPAAGGPTAGEASRAAIAACAAAATLYPAERLARTDTATAVVGRHWARREGGRGSMHGPPELWRRNTDLRLERVEDAIAMTYEVLVETSHEAPKTTRIARSCQVCGELLVCDQTVWVLATRTNEPPNGSPLEVLAMDAVAELGDHDLYLVRHGHEVYLDFGADPRTAAKGPLEIRVRKLEQGAAVTTRATTFEAEPMAAGYAGRNVRIELPGADGIRLEYRPDRPPSGGGYGTDTTLEPTLYEMESLQRNPQLMEQPASLAVSPDAPGFNLPH